MAEAMPHTSSAGTRPFKRPDGAQDYRSRANKWSFSISNHSEDDIRSVKALGEQDILCGIASRDRGETESPTIEGYVNFRATRTYAAVRKLLPRAHLEPGRGTDAENWEACSTGRDVFWRVGEPQRRGKRNDLSAAVTMVKAGRGLREIAETHPETFVRYGRGLRDLMLLTGSKPRDFKTEVWILWGPSGCGKSRFCNQFEGTKYYKTLGDWWDGYTGEENVVIDDFDGWLPFCEMLQVMDRYPHKVPVKGSFVEFTSKRIFITSNKCPYDW